MGKKNTNFSVSLVVFACGVPIKKIRQVVAGGISETELEWTFALIKRINNNTFKTVFRLSFLAKVAGENPQDNQERKADSIPFRIVIRVT